MPTFYQKPRLLPKNYPVTMPFLSTVRTIGDLRGPAGRLEALLNTGLNDAPFTALIAHPHPPSGGTMHTKVVYHTAKAFSAFGLPVLRFNFRGTGLSEGIHDEGRGEVDDVRAALDYLTTHFQKPILLAGFSFGANVALRAGCAESTEPAPRVAALIALGLPIQAAGRDYSYTFLPRCRQPKLFISGAQDQFCPPEVLAALLATAAPPWHSVIIPNAEHFFQGIPPDPTPKLDQLRTHITDWLTHQFALQKL